MPFEFSILIRRSAPPRGLRPNDNSSETSDEGSLAPSSSSVDESDASGDEPGRCRRFILVLFRRTPVSLCPGGGDGDVCWKRRPRRALGRGVRRAADFLPFGGCTSLFASPVATSSCDGSESDLRPRVACTVIFGGGDKEGSVQRRRGRGETERCEGGETEGLCFFASRLDADARIDGFKSFPSSSVYRRAGRSGGRRRNSAEIILSFPQCLSNCERVNSRGSQKSFAEWPEFETSFASAPYESSSDTRSTSACCTANMSGVMPCSSAKLGDALASRRYSAQCRWWRKDRCRCEW